MAERLTDRSIAALKPSDISVLFFDSEVSGLAVRVYPSGRKVFVFDWRDDGKQRRVTIGQHPTWTIGKARTHASRMRLKADTGESVAPGRGSRIADLIERSFPAHHPVEHMRPDLAYGLRRLAISLPMKDLGFSLRHPGKIGAIGRKDPLDVDRL